jgi:hypothetical protein
MDDTKFTDTFMAEQRELAEKATERPWEAIKLNADGAVIRVSGYEIRTPDYDVVAHMTHQPPIRKQADVLFIEAAANHYPAALDEIDRLRAANESQYAGLTDQVNRLDTRLARAERMYKTLDTIYAFFTREASEPDSKIPTEILIKLMTEIEAVTGKEEYWP